MFVGLGLRLTPVFLGNAKLTPEHLRAAPDRLEGVDDTTYREIAAWVRDQMLPCVKRVRPAVMSASLRGRYDTRAGHGRPVHRHLPSVAVGGVDRSMTSAGPEES
ncbi:hypothetical protein BKA18_006657 [Streptomyces auratus]